MAENVQATVRGHIESAFAPIFNEPGPWFDHVQYIKNKTVLFANQLQAGEITSEEYVQLIEDLKVIEQTKQVADKLHNKILLEKLFEALKVVVKLVV